MSFSEYREIIEEGDTAIVYKSKQDVSAIKVTVNQILQVKGGAIPHNLLIGKRYGSKVYTTNMKTWVYVVHPSPELWTVTLPHRTQIVYSVDVSLITLQLGLNPGSVVCESGTGSGSVSHAIARTIAPTGHLYTFDFHQQRAETASIEFASHNLDKIITVKCCDVCTDGFGLENMADAVFLDLPEPWRAVESSRKALKISGGRFASFSPCIEQIQRTCDVLRDFNFVDVEVLECLLRPFEVRSTIMVKPNLGLQAPDSKEVNIGDQAKGNKGCSTPSSTSSKGRMELKTAHPLQKIAGHTGFLVFATLNPKPNNKEKSLLK